MMVLPWRKQMLALQWWVRHLWKGLFKLKDLWNVISHRLVQNMKTHRNIYSVCGAHRFSIVFLSPGNCRDGCGQRGIWHHSDWWQLFQYCQSCHVGTQRLWQHLKVPPVSANCQRGGCHCSIYWSLYHTGWHQSFKLVKKKCILVDVQQ